MFPVRNILCHVPGTLQCPEAHNLGVEAVGQKRRIHVARIITTFTVEKEFEHFFTLNGIKERAVSCNSHHNIGGLLFGHLVITVQYIIRASSEH